MLSDYILFFGLAIVAVGSGLGVLLSKNAVYSALNLILNFITVAIFYLLLNAPFIALAQITVYAGAIMVLFLFVIMLLGAESLHYAGTIRWQKPLALVLSAILLVEAAYILFVRPGVLNLGSAVEAGFGSPAAVGEVLFSRYLLPFEVVSVLLLAAMVGAIVLTKRKRGEL